MWLQQRCLPTPDGSGGLCLKKACFCTRNAATPGARGCGLSKIAFFGKAQSVQRDQVLNKPQKI